MFKKILIKYHELIVKRNEKSIEQWNNVIDSDMLNSNEKRMLRRHVCDCVDKVAKSKAKLDKLYEK